MCSCIEKLREPDLSKTINRRNLTQWIVRSWHIPFFLWQTDGQTKILARPFEMPGKTSNFVDLFRLEEAISTCLRFSTLSFTKALSSVNQLACAILTSASSKIFVVVLQRAWIGMDGSRGRNKALLEDYTTCNICFEPYDAESCGKRAPITSPCCGQSACRGCIDTFHVLFKARSH